MAEKDLTILSSFHTKSLRKIVRILWPRIVSKQDLLDYCQQDSIEKVIVQKRWRWIAHVLRKDQNVIPRVAVQRKPEGHKKRGRPKITWKRTVKAETATMGQS
ncbi:endonuclease-reverse transcriptase [Elysia marginata]|uniref:Endonuclease-reverse transcriptase n=1 Tax=Elysia marginata TaxID=1093978 RepID=A0AAV4J1V9_9GAST|nr:endonuclease-reverse transcriptase [Elysia marginata]